MYHTILYVISMNPIYYVTIILCNTNTNYKYKQLEWGICSNRSIYQDIYTFSVHRSWEGSKKEGFFKEVPKVFSREIKK